MDASGTVQILKAVYPLIGSIAGKSEEENEELFRQLADSLEVKLGAVLMPLRVAVTGSTVSPPIIGSIKLLGVEKVMARVERAIKKLNSEVVDG